MSIAITREQLPEHFAFQREFSHRGDLALFYLNTLLHEYGERRFLGNGEGAWYGMDETNRYCEYLDEGEEPSGLVMYAIQDFIDLCEKGLPLPQEKPSSFSQFIDKLNNKTA